ncbi:hypothetical protein [Actinoalloteichus caeruleus]|uniref:hypothetical protein n=1 Tax=Actinoalloteichus cyanogriseus TaxID=2893586 RepID=UPI003AAA2770
MSAETDTEQEGHAWLPQEHVVEVALLTLEDDGETAVFDGTTRLDLQDGESLGEDSPESAVVVAELLDATVRLRSPEECDAELVSAFLARSVPPAFVANPWLNGHRALVLRGGRAEVGGRRLRYQPGLGLVEED